MIARVYASIGREARSVVRAELVAEIEVTDDEEVSAADYGGDFVHYVLDWHADDVLEEDAVLV